MPIWRVIRNKLEDNKRITNNSYLLHTIDNQQPALFDISNGDVMVNNYNMISQYPVFIQDNMEEIWNPVVYSEVVPNMYWISTYGRCMNSNGQMIKPYKINSGYLVYRLYKGYSVTSKNGIDRSAYLARLAHRMVMESFSPIHDPESNYVNHIDGNKENNCIWNLEWVTQRENNIYAGKHNQNRLLGVMWDDSFAEEICKAIIKFPDATNRQIYQYVSGEYGTNSDKARVSKIRHGQTYTIISSKYGISNK